MQFKPKVSAAQRFAFAMAFALVLATLLATQIFPLAPNAAANPQHKTLKSQPPALPVEKDQPVPFHTGEALDYRVAWAAFSNAASVELSVPERRNLLGWQTWHFRASAHTLSPVRSLFAVDDQFDSYADAATLESHQYESHLNELGRKEDDVLHLVVDGQPPRGPAPSVVVLPGTHDPLDALYTLRGVDWQRTPRFRAPVYDGKNLYEMEAQRENAGETVEVAAGNFPASRISIRLFQYEREVTGIHFIVWLASDAARTPVLMQADLPFGHLRAELTSASR